MPKENPKDVLLKIARDPLLRKTAAQQNHALFFSIYLGHYATYPIAALHKDMFELSQDTKRRLIAIMAFRGSGKSTILTLSYVLWAILGQQQKKCVIIISKTQQQAKTHFFNIQREL